MRLDAAFRGRCRIESTADDRGTVKDEVLRVASEETQIIDETPVSVPTSHPCGGTKTERPGSDGTGFKTR